MGASQQTAVTAATQEVRFATVWTGGVSLAIWMGGVARELNLLDQAGRQREGVATVPIEQLSPADQQVRSRYLALLDLLDVVVRIDVLSGTSAGGINAALLGTCHATGWDLGWLRDVWLTAGDLGLLLRDPASKDPPSLLRGDGVLLAQLDENLKRTTPMVDEVRPTTVHITTTLLEGETSRFTDSYGTLVPDVNHLGVFQFTTPDLRQETGRRALALAARSSASFPGAFEPAFLPYGQDVRAVGNDPGPSERPAVERYLSITRSHWAADGGILANQPIRPILDSIFEQPAQARQVRRVLLYVVPDAGGTPRPEDDPVHTAQIDQPLTLARALLGDVGSALSQSVAAELTDIQQHNERVDAMRDSRLRLAELGVSMATVAPQVDPSEAASLGADIFPTAGAWADYVSRQGEWLVRPVMRSIMQSLSTMPVGAMPERWRAEVAMGQAIELTCCREASRHVTAAWTRPSPTSSPDELATLGRSAYDGVKAILVSLFQLAYAANPVAERRERLAALGQRLHAAFRPADGELPQTMVTASVDHAANDPNGPTLVELTTQLATHWVAELDAGTNEPLGAPAPRAPAGLPAAWELLQGVLEDLMPELAAIATAVPTTASPTATSSVGKLATYIAFLGDDPDRWRSRLVGLHVMDRSMLPVGADVDQKVQLVQASATTRTLLDPERTTPTAKLTGMQFNHFGAFYKASWRANDWMWGRLDGAGWLVHVLLDPRRILTIADADPTEYPPGQRASAFMKRLAALAGPAVDATSQAARDALAELGFLDQSGAPDDPPLSLPATALWLAQSWQRPIVANELPVVAREALATPTRRDQAWAVGALRQAGQAELAEAASRQATAFVATGRSPRREKRHAGAAPAVPISAPPTSPPAAPPTQPLLDESMASLGALLQSCPVPQERLSQERGEPLFTHTVTKATAVTTAAATAVKKAPATINVVFRTARTTTLTGYRAADVVGFWPRRVMAAGAIIAAFGVLLGAQGSAFLGLTGVVLVLAGLYLIAFGVWSTSPRIFGALLALTLVVAVFALAIPSTRRFLFGTDDGTDEGWVTEHLVPWMRDRWWALLLILAIIIVVPTMASYVARRRAVDRVKQTDARTGGQPPHAPPA